MLRSTLLSAALVCCSAAQPSIDQVLDSLDKVQKIEAIAMSPDGHRLAWVQKHLYWTELGAANTPRRLTACPGDCAETGPAWSPDGSRLAFLSDADKKGQAQVYVAAIGKKEGKPKRLTNLTGHFEDVRWSPDGRSIAVLFTENAPRSLGPVEAVIPEVGVIDEKVFIQRIALIDPDSGAVRQLTPAKLHVFEYGWSPDSKRLVYDAAPPPGDDNWYTAELYSIDAANGEVRNLLKPGMQMANPRWSPDGKTIAFIGGLMSDEGVTGGDIYTMPAEGGPARDIMPGSKSSPGWFEWSPSSDSLLVVDHAAGTTLIENMDLEGQRKVLWSGAETIEFSGNAAASAVVRSSWSIAPEIWAGPTGRWEQITHANADQKPMWGEAKSIEWKSDHFQVQGWLLLPRGFIAGRQYPLIVVPHGGPSGEKRPAWPSPFFDLSVLSGRGYFVFYPNFRGSYGQGEAFTRANVKDFGHGDLRDILAGIDKVAAEYPIDEKRIGIAGWSYGGYMTMWAVTQTDRFRAAIAGAGLSNWQSYYGENSIDQWMIPFFGASVYDDPEVYARSSPMAFIKNVKTPTLVVVGERDGEVPEPQSREFWHGLKTIGIDTQLVIYEGEGHRFHDPGHMRDVMRRTAAWFDRYMPASQSAEPTR